MSVRVRFAPSPTGQVHIGNIRAAIFNWLFARNQGGKFLLRIEDTDLERSTPEAIESLLKVMQWMELDFDEQPLYQTSQVEKHLAAAQQLLAQGDAYLDRKGGEGEAVLFRIPLNTEKMPGLQEIGTVEVAVHPEVPVTVSGKGIDFAGISNKGKPAPGGFCLTGGKNLQVLDADGKCLFDLTGQEERFLRSEERQEVPGAARLRFVRRAIVYQDLVKGEMSKPLDSLRDLVIVRSDGSPVFHLANVVDDITQDVTHIIRGDDHVENTFRHIMLFACLNQRPPAYAHLPMIVNAAGKPYSKRDGDAFVGDFRERGFLPEALFNYLTLLGWSPGDDREKMTKPELIEAFSLKRVQRASAQMDGQKLLNLNGQYMAEMEQEKFMAECQRWLEKMDWGKKLEEELFTKVCRLMQSRLKVFADVTQWKHFFVETPDYDRKLCARQFRDLAVVQALRALPEKLAATEPFSAETLETVLSATAGAVGLAPGKLNQPLRAAVTGCAIGAGIFETLEVLGKKRTVARLRAEQWLRQE